MSLEDAGTPVHFCEACEQFKSKDYNEFVKHLSTEHKLTSDDYNYMFGSSSEAEVGPQTPVKSPISVIELGDSPVKDGEAGKFGSINFRAYANLSFSKEKRNE